MAMGVGMGIELCNPHLWFPRARSIRRRLVAHLGPTNSGKTHGALQALLSAGRGIYCGPLRLLAQELYESINADGRVRCGLRTGEAIWGWRGRQDQTQGGAAEAWRADGASHLACTVELADLEPAGHSLYDVGVIDEVQMVADGERGWAFTQALLGLPCRTVYVCGEPAMEPLLRALAGVCGDELEVVRFDRLRPLQAENSSLRGRLTEIVPGDALVAFSRHGLYSLRRRVVRATGLPCAMVYGGLPLEHRSAQADAFNAGRLPILVASDAIGMGLNLAVRRVVFASLDKRLPGGLLDPLSQPAIKQIAGRAGRYGREGVDRGLVTCLEQGHFSRLRLALQAETPAYRAAGLAPPDRLILAAARDRPLERVIGALADPAVPTDALYFACGMQQMSDNLRLLGPDIRRRLCPEHLLVLARAPVKPKQAVSRRVFAALAEHIASARSGPLCVPLPRLPPPGAAIYGSPEIVLGVAEDVHRALELVQWTQLRFPWALPSSTHSLARQQERVALLITELLSVC